MNNHPLFSIPFFGITSLCQTPFKAFKIKSPAQILKIFNQGGFYKICLITGRNIIRYSNKEIKTEGTNLFFANANNTCNWESISEEQKGYACILSKKFLKKFDYLNILQQSSLFHANAVPVFPLSNEQENFITAIFHKLILEQSTDYIYKDELIRNWISLIMHEALKIKTTNYFLFNPALLS